MPSRKRPNLGKRSRVAQKKRCVRENESDLERQQRLRDQREIQSTSRANETQAERELRLASDRANNVYGCRM